MSPFGGGDVAAFLLGAALVGLWWAVSAVRQQSEPPRYDRE